MVVANDLFIVLYSARIKGPDGGISAPSTASFISAASWLDAEEIARTRLFERFPTNRGFFSQTFNLGVVPREVVRQHATQRGY